MLALAVLVLADGFWGPQLAPKNLAGILPWVHWRGFVALSLLLAGNLFCMACPFMLPRRLAKKLLPATRHWPKALRTKWLAIALLFLFLWAYEAFDLWSSPLLTAWLALTYFAAAFVIDGLFRGAAFCKYVCPIGHFHFVNSLASPLEVAIREPEVCAYLPHPGLHHGSVRGAPGVGPRRTSPEAPRTGRLLQNGCELWLYQETKLGNMDCTFCMECIHACPHDNVGILTRAPAKELWVDPRRAGVGRFSQRPDLAALAVFLTFAAFMNAFGMVTPVYALESWLAGVIGDLLGAPGGGGPLPDGHGAACRRCWWERRGLTSARLSGSRAWRGAGGDSLRIRPGSPRLRHVGGPLSFPLPGGRPRHCSPRPGISGVRRLRLRRSPLLGSGPPGPGLLAPSPGAPRPGAGPPGVAGGGRTASPTGRSAPAQGRLRAFAPWGGLALLLSLAGVWLLLQPMEMRGTLMGG